MVQNIIKACKLRWNRYTRFTSKSTLLTKCCRGFPTRPLPTTIEGIALLTVVAVVLSVHDVDDGANPSSISNLKIQIVPMGNVRYLDEETTRI